MTVVLEEFAVDRRGVDHDARGRFTRGSAVGRALDAGESLDGFSRPQLQREVRRRNKEGAGIKVRRGATADEIRAALQSPQSPQKVDGNDRIEARRARQARIDAVRAVSNPARKVYQDAGAAGRAEDWAKMDEVDRDLRRVGARLFGMPETIFQFDRERHKIIEEEPGDRERTGGRMIGVRPGAFWDEEGIVLDKAQVMPAVESEAEVAAYWREQEIDVHALMKQREQTWKEAAMGANQTATFERMHEFHPAPPPHVQSSHGNRGGRKAAAVPDTPKAVKAATRARAPKAATAVKGKPKLKDLVAKQKPSDKETVAAANEIWGGTFGGLTAKVTSATPVHMGSGKLGNQSLVVEGVITDASGKKVGKFHRSITSRGGVPGAARHTRLEIDSGVRGQGFAEGFNQNAIDWYRDNGIKEVELHADIDVGGYAWARAGYDWDGESSPRSVLTAVLAASGEPSAPSSVVLRENLEKIPAERLAEQRQLADDLFGRSETADFGTAGYPTPYEISQLGRWPGAGKDDMWIGKAIMLGSDWHGVRHL